MTTLYCYCQLKKDLIRLTERYSHCRLETIGHSVLGRPIYALVIGQGAYELHYNGAFHGSEALTSKLLLHFADYFLENLSCPISPLYALEQELSLWLVPMVNPDGVELVCHGLEAVDPAYHTDLLAMADSETGFTAWKANIRGIDLNDQFPAYWETEAARRDTPGPGPLNYPGLQPLSEPEAQAIAELTLAHDFQLVMAWHSQGEEIYWGYRGFEPPQAETLASKMAASSGYLPVRYVESDAGYKDWFILNWQRPGFTIECGLGVNPLPLTDLVDIWPKCVDILSLGLRTAKG